MKPRTADLLRLVVLGTVALAVALLASAITYKTMTLFWGPK